MKRTILISAVFLTAGLFAQQGEQVGASPGPGARYASDAYPGFDTEKDSFAPERKEPRWFAFINGPAKDTSAGQLDYCRELEEAESWSKAAKAYDALVRQWPASREAPVAQRRLADILFEKLDDASEALAEYRYLTDFYSFDCDYDAVVNRMYEVACRMEVEGRTILYFRFRNTVEVRRAFELCVVRAPGADWAPKAMLTIARLREDEGKLDSAVAVYENLRNLHYGTPEARTGTLREASVRVRLLDDHGYNRARTRDTVDFLSLAKAIVPDEDTAEIDALLAVARGRLDDESYESARFYDSRMRTKRSAVSAYERYLADFPEGAHAEEVRRRLDELKGAE